MANWDQAQLAEVIERRHGEENSKKNTTQIVSDGNVIQGSKNQSFSSDDRGLVHRYSRLIQEHFSHRTVLHLEVQAEFSFSV